MRTDPNQVIVHPTECSACSAVHTTRVHHREFPEVWAECGSSAEGATHLMLLLSRFLDGAGSHYRRDAIEQALADVEAFLDTLAEAGVGAPDASTAIR
jgi:hypothetical protein